jgi:hypothetical protein
MPDVYEGSDAGIQKDLRSQFLRGRQNFSCIDDGLPKLTTFSELTAQSESRRSSSI